MSGLPPVTQRIAAVLILLGGVGFIYLVLIAPVLDDYLATRQAVDETFGSIERFRGVAAAWPERQKQLAELRAREAQSASLLKGVNDALVAAQIHDRIKTLVEAMHGELKSTQVLPVQEEGRYRRITIRAQMTLDIAAAEHVLHGVEASSPLLLLENVDLRAHTQGRPRRPGEMLALESALDVRMDVFGYMLTPKQAGNRQAAAGAVSAGAAR